MIRALMGFNIIGERREGRVGIWVRNGAPSNPASREDKIAAIGVRIRRWVSVSRHQPSTSSRTSITFPASCPAESAQHGVTSLWDQGVTATMNDVDLQLRQSFRDVFGR